MKFRTGDFMRKIRTLIYAGILLSALFLTGCGKKEEVRLVVWSPEASKDLMQEMADEFAEEYAKEAEIYITVRSQDEDSAADNLMHNAGQDADVFLFAGDQIDRLINAGKLLPVTEYAEQVIQENGGENSAAIKCASKGDRLYAYPLTASNGYFLFYNGACLTEEDVQTLDGLLDAVERENGYFSMDWTSGWYIHSFFGGAGMHIAANEDGVSNSCDWNRTDGGYTGVEVAQAMLAVSARKGFLNTDDAGFKKGVADGTILAGVNGTWNAEYVASCWGDDYCASKLPTYTLDGEQVQMGSFAGFKLVGVNADTASPQWASRFANYISNEENQRKRFNETGECPSNVNAAQSPRVQQSQALKALGDQAPYAVRQSISGNFWTPATIFGTIMASGNPDNRDLQEILDELVESATIPEE